MRSLAFALSAFVIFFSAVSPRCSWAQASLDIYERPVKSSSGSVSIAPSGNCNGSGQNLFLKSSFNVPMAVMVCKRTKAWEGEGSKWTRTYLPYHVAPHTKPIFLGCSRGDSASDAAISEMRVAWQDVDTGYFPASMSNAANVLVKQRSSRSLLLSNQSGRYVFVSFLITGKNYQATLEPLGVQSLGSNGEVTVAHYSFPSSDATSCDEK